MRGHEQKHLDDATLRPKADRVSEQEDATVFRAAAAGRADVVGPQGLLRLQRAVGNRGVGNLAEEERSPVLDVVSSGGGSSLDAPVRQDMEARLGHDFGDVRVHTGDAAHHSATAVNAHAYTVGSNIVFQRDRYDPSSTQGRTMLAHELTHVVQQRSGPVDGTATGDGVRVSDPSDRFEREASATAERAIALTPATVSVATPAGAVSPSVQRDAGGEQEEQEDPVQGAFVQRDEAEQEEEPA